MAEAEAAARPLTRGTAVAIAVVTLTWAAGIVLREPLEQAAYVGAVLLAVGLLLTRRVAYSRDLRAWAAVGLVLVAWRALSPAVALLTGASHGWPPGSRYWSAFEPLGAVALPVLAAGIPWMAIAAVLGFGWLASTVIATYQHFVRWPFDFPAFLKISTERVRENFAVEGPPRYGAGGFLFHRLRFAHAGIALLGPALALVGWREVELQRRGRLLAGAVGAAILFGISMTYARAALGAGLLVVGAGFLLFARGWMRRGGLLLGAAVVLVALTSPGWRVRFAHAEQNVMEGERRQAMTAGWMIFREHPIAGVGFGNHKQHADALREVLHMPGHITWDSHDLWITALAETGVIGFALLLAFHALLALALLRRARDGSVIAAGALLSFVGFHVLSLVHYLPFHPSVALAFYFVWGLGLASRDPGALGVTRSTLPDRPRWPDRA